MKRKCKLYNRSDIVRYLQNRMSREEESNFQRHLTVCSECFEDTKRLRALISTLGTPQRKYMAIWVAAATVAIMIVGGASVMLLRQQNRNTDSGFELQYDPAPIYNDSTSVEKDSLYLDSIRNIITK